MTVIERLNVPAPSRQSGNWIKAYLEWTKESESPDAYHVWAALSTLSATVKRSVWIDQGLYVLYPNLYVALVGPPARTAKSTAIHFSSQLLANVPTVVMGPDACSREQLIREMAEAKLNNVCALTVYSSEFSSIVDTSGLLMIQFLTDIYDGNYVRAKGWKYATKTSGKDDIINPYLTIMVGTTPSYLSESMPDNIHGHGFTSRTIFVYEEEERLINPRPPQMDVDLAKALVNDLNYISQLQGQFIWTDDGKAAYDDFYKSLYKPDNIPQDNRIQGYHWRKKVHVLKVAMLLSLAENDEMKISAREIDTAAQLLAAIEPNMARTFSAVGKFEHASDLERIAFFVTRKGGCAVSEIFQNFYHIGSHDEIRQILQTLVIMDCIDLEVRNDKQWAVPGRSSLPGYKSRTKSS